MATERVHAALQATFTDPNPVTRKEAEAYIMEMSKHAGAVKAFYEIAVADHVAPPIRQAAGIRLRQLLDCRTDWNSDKMKQRVSDEEKAMLKTTILSAIATVPKAVQTQLLVIVEWVAKWDFPERWQNLVPELGGFLTSGENQKVMAGLYTLRRLVKRYEQFEGDARRTEVNTVAESFFPLLLQIFESTNKLSATQDANVAEVQKLLLKIFSSCNKNRVVQHIVESSDMCDRWMRCILFALQMPPPADHTPQALCWKVKKWGGYIVQDLLHAYGNPAKCSPRSGKDVFAKHFAPNYAPQFLQTVLTLLKSAHAMRMPPKPVCRFIMAVESGYATKALYPVVQKEIEEVMQKVFFRYMCWSDDDHELWTDNPEEYVRKTHTVFRKDDLDDPAVFSTHFMQQLCTAPKKFHDKGVVFRFLAFLNDVLTRTAAGANDLGAMKERYGAYQTISGLKPVLINIDQVKAQMEELLVSHVFPGFESSFGFIRAASLYLVSQYARIDWQSPDHFRRALSANIAMMRDRELPVRIQAGSVVQRLITKKHARDVVKPLLGQIIEAIFSLMTELDSDVLVQTLEVVIGGYGEELEGQAVQICQTLINHFQHITREVVQAMARMGEDGGPSMDDLSGGDSLDTLAAGAQCVSALTTLVLALQHKPEVVTTLQITCMPMMQALCTVGFYEFFQETVKLIVVILVHSNAITPEFWNIFNALHVAFTTFARDSIQDCLAPFDNFISKDPKAFLADLTRIEKIRSVCVLMLEGEMSTRSERKTSPKLMEVLLQACKPFHQLLDPYVPAFYDTCMKSYAAPYCKDALKLLLCNVFLTGLWYNTSATLEYLEARGVTGQVFMTVFQLVPQYQTVWDMKVLSLGFTTVLEYGLVSALPGYFTDEVRMNMAKASFEVAMKRYVLVKEQDEMDDEEDEESDEDEEDFGAFGLMGGFDEDEDADGPMGVMGNQSGVMHGNDTAALAELIRQNKVVAKNEDYAEELARYLSQAREEGVDNDDFDLDDDFDDADVWSIIDEISDVGLIRAYLEKMRAGNAAAFAKFTSMVPTEMLNQFDAAAEFSEEKAKKAVEENKNMTYNTYTGN